MPTLDLGRVTGKTAYEYAVDGGYTGTEAEFQALMGSGPWLPEVPAIEGSAQRPGKALQLETPQGMTAWRMVFERPSSNNGAVLISPAKEPSYPQGLVVIDGVDTPDTDYAAANKAYVDSLIEQVKADTMKAMEKIACLVIPSQGTTQTAQRINVKLIPRGTSDYSLTYEGTVPQHSSQYIRLEPPPGYAFTGLAYTWLPALKIGTEYRVGTLNADGSITFALQASDVTRPFTFVSRDSQSSPAYFLLEVA